jgi:hypothetical protein
MNESEVMNVPGGYELYCPADIGPIHQRHGDPGRGLDLRRRERDLAIALEGLRTAKQRIATPADWWAKGQRLETKNHPRCAMQAIWDCYAPADIEQVEVCKALCDITARYFCEANGLEPRDAMSIIDWNDAEGRTHDEVTAAYDKAIAYLCAAA